MAKSAAPLILGLGAAALLLSGKRKKKSESDPGKIEVDTHGEYSKDKFDPNAENALMVLDQECMEIAQKINPTAHNTYITNRFNQLVAEGWDDTDAITLQILMDQSNHCPWQDRSLWTPIMKGLYEQLSKGVKKYYEIYNS